MMAFLLSLFGAVAVQKNVRDLEYLRVHTLTPEISHQMPNDPFNNDNPNT